MVWPVHIPKGVHGREGVHHAASAGHPTLTEFVHEERALHNELDITVARSEGHSGTAACCCRRMLLSTNIDVDDSWRKACGIDMFANRVLAHVITPAGTAMAASVRYCSRHGSSRRPTSSSLNSHLAACLLCAGEACTGVRGRSAISRDCLSRSRAKSGTPHAAKATDRGSSCYRGGSIIGTLRQAT